MITTYKFEEIKRKQKIKIKCERCNKIRTRTLEVSQTLNPYNKNKKTGEAKTFEEITRENDIKLKDIVKEFQSKPFVCCEKEGAE